MPDYRPRQAALPAFTVTGFTKIVASGGEQFGAVRSDGRWEVLRRLGGEDPTIYGVASHDAECGSEGRYRYTVGIKAPEGGLQAADVSEGLFSIPIPASDWLIFTVCFADGSFGKLWEGDPYRIIRELGWEFNRAVGLHIDVYSPAYATDADRFEFWMPVRRRGQEEA